MSPRVNGKCRRRVKDVTSDKVVRFTSFGNTTTPSPYELRDVFNMGDKLFHDGNTYS